jgi:Flp pilus assembly protein TadG
MKPRAGIAGGVATEFAISVSVVLILMVGVIDLGRLFATQHALDYGAERASRYAAVNSTSATSATIKSQLVTAITPAVGASRAAAAVVSVSFAPSYKVGGTVTVSVTLGWTASAAIDALPAITLSSSQTLTVQH